MYYLYDIDSCSIIHCLKNCFDFREFLFWHVKLDTKLYTDRMLYAY